VPWTHRVAPEKPETPTGAGSIHSWETPSERRMDEKPEAGSPRAAKSSRQGRSKSVRLPPRDSYPLTEIIAAWKDYLDEEGIVEYIKLGKLTCGVLLGDRFAVRVDGALLRGHDPAEFPRVTALFPDGDPLARARFQTLEPV